MKVVVTGGSGFIGQYVVSELAKSGLEVVVFDKNYIECQGINFICGDIFDFESLIAAARGAEVLIHLVGLPDAREAQRNPSESFQLNLASLQNSLEACRICQIPRLIYPSTAAVYGQTQTVPISEEDPPRPTGIYAYHKWLGEELVRAYHAVYGINYTILRLFNVYGRGNKGILQLCIDAAKKGEPITVFGADQKRDFIYAGDVAKAFKAAILSDALRNKTINIGSGKGRTIRHVVEMMKELLPNLKVVYKEIPEMTPYDSVADITLARNLLDFEPHTEDEFFKKVVKEEMICHA